MHVNTSHKIAIFSKTRSYFREMMSYDCTALILWFTEVPKATCRLPADRSCRCCIGSLLVTAPLQWKAADRQSSRRTSEGKPVGTFSVKYDPVLIKFAVLCNVWTYIVKFCSLKQWLQSKLHIVALSLVFRLGLYKMPWHYCDQTSQKIRDCAELQASVPNLVLIVPKN